MKGDLFFERKFERNKEIFLIVRIKKAKRTRELTQVKQLGSGIFFQHL